MFDTCNDRDNPDSHNYLVPVCADCSAWEGHWFHDNENPDRHDFKLPTEPLVWGENAHRENKCERYYEVEPDEYNPDGYLRCSCPCHWEQYYVNVYDVTRAYGGPEEGGWWYDTGEPIASWPYKSYEEAKTFANAARMDYPYTKARYSMLDRENDYDVRVESHYGQPFPEETPRYS